MRSGAPLPTSRIPVPAFRPSSPATTMPESVQSLDTISNSSGDSYDSDEEDRLAELEWQESLQQLQQLLSIVLLPYLGKWLGRRWSYWGTYNPAIAPTSSPPSLISHLTKSQAYARYVRLGLGKSFFLGERGL
ncbi:hypothetical protein BD311DRAFT_861067 [Dichomitus squalens]|uniref:Uncharacterized protein n=1 Tax=Dichomitus squalens TaxID=114155 RepID=A0A4Q9N6U2_9APHY|nr:hypothetical protein BD311DRAFT_861067 [Dichomitus squalens]